MLKAYRTGDAQRTPAFTTTHDSRWAIRTPHASARRVKHGYPNPHGSAGTFQHLRGVS